MLRMRPFLLEKKKWEGYHVIRTVFLSRMIFFPPSPQRVAVVGER